MLFGPVFEWKTHAPFFGKSKIRIYVSSKSHNFFLFFGLIGFQFGNGLTENKARLCFSERKLKSVKQFFWIDAKLIA